MYTITLKDGTKIKNLTLNGNNYVSPVEIDESIFTEDNLSTIIINDGEKDEELKDMMFVQQKHYDFMEGYYLCFKEMSLQDKLRKSMEENSQSINDILVALLGGN